MGMQQAVLTELKMYFVERQGEDLLNEAIALRVMNQSGANPNHLQFLLEASKHRQIVMAKAENGEPMASLTFAKISKYTLRLLASNTEHKLQPYEYHEGKILYVLDGFFKKNSFKKSVALLKSQLKKFRIIAYVKNDSLRIVYNNNGLVKFIKLSNMRIEGKKLMLKDEGNSQPKGST